MASISICITGQLRNAEEALECLRDALGDQEALLVFSIWDRVGAKVHGAVNRDQLDRLFDPAVCELIPQAWLGHPRLWQALPSLYQAREREAARDGDPEALRATITRRFPEAVVDIERSDLLDLEFGAPGEDRNSLRMLYKAWRANQIRRRLERARGTSPVAVRMRPDLKVLRLDPALLRSAAASGTLLVDGVLHDRGFMGDSFAAGGPAAIDHYCALFARAIASPEQWEFIHTGLYRHLQAASLDIQRYPWLGGLARDTTIPRHALEAALDECLRNGQAATLAHHATLQALRASAQLAAGNLADALGALLAVPPGPDTDLSGLDGYFLVLARLCARLGWHAEATCCLALFAEGRDTPPVAWHLHDLEVLAHHLPPAFPGDDPPDPVALSVAMFQGMGGTPVRALLLQHAAPERLALSVARLFAAAWPHLPRRLGLPRHAHLRASALSLAGTPQTALACLERLLETSPDDLEALFLGADLCKGLRRFAQARDLQARALLLAPDHAGAARQMAELCLALTDMPAAEHHARRAFALDPAAPEHAALLAHVLALQGHAHAAAELAGRLPASLDFPPAFRRLPGFPAFASVMPDRGTPATMAAPR